MLDKFFESVSGELGKDWLAAVFKPAFLFWAGGVIAWALHSDSHWKYLKERILDSSMPARVLAILIVYLVVIGSDLTVSKANVLAARFLEGYWPRRMSKVRALLTQRWDSRCRKADELFQRLQAKRDAGTLTFEDKGELAAIERMLRSFPARSPERMPTRLGNLLRAAERRSRDKYGLDAIVCWPRLWLLLPEGAKGDLKDARTKLDRAIDAWLWSMLFLVWAVWAWWAAPVLAGLGMFLSYRWALFAAEPYGDLIESTFDVYRMALYRSLRWPEPKGPQEEPSFGDALTEYLLRGSTDATVRFQECPTGAGGQ